MFQRIHSEEPNNVLPKFHRRFSFVVVHENFPTNFPEISAVHTSVKLLPEISSKKISWSFRPDFCRSSSRNFSQRFPKFFPKFRLYLHSKLLPSFFLDIFSRSFSRYSSNSCFRSSKSLRGFRGCQGRVSESLRVSGTPHWSLKGFQKDSEEFQGKGFSGINIEPYE